MLGDAGDTGNEEMSFEEEQMRKAVGFSVKLGRTVGGAGVDGTSIQVYFNVYKSIAEEGEDKIAYTTSDLFQIL